MTFGVSAMRIRRLQSIVFCASTTPSVTPETFMSILYKNYRLSPEEYLEGEKYSTVKHEYIKGDVYAMVSVSLAHNLITNNLNMRLYQHLRGTPYRVFVADVKVRVEKNDAVRLESVGLEMPIADIYEGVGE